jgi:predicted AlkP superfamily phosphohydrolase/phosphomutase
MGSWSVFTTEPVTADNAHTETGGERVPLDPARREFETRIVGPANFLVQEELDRIEQRLPGVSGYEEHEKLAAERDALRARLDTTVPLALRWEPEARRVRIAAGGREETVAEGAWTGFLPVTFRLNPIVRLQALARFRVLEASPGLRVYQEPLSFDPSHPPAFLPLSWPEGFAVELSREIGLFDTVGWGCATNPLKDGQIGEEAFLEDVASVMQAREKMLDLELARRDARCVVAVFGEQDRVQHMMWRLTDPRSPTWDEELARRHGGAILDVYRAMDRIVGRARATGADVLVVSDHGFQPFHIGVNVNTWLVENGWLRLKGQAVLESLGKKLDDLYRPDGSDPVDWSKTRAYSMGLGKIYLNVAGREPSGIVPASERAALLRELQRQLLAWKDGEGRPVVKSALPAEEIFQGPEALTDADLFLGFHSGFRVSWVTTLLGFEKGTLAPNRQKWSGDHCSVDPDLVPGILVTNLKLDAATAALWDVAPTVLSYFGVPAPEVTDGRSLLR